MLLFNKKDRIIFKIFSLIIVFYQVFSETTEKSERADKQERTVKRKLILDFVFVLLIRMEIFPSHVQWVGGGCRRGRRGRSRPLLFGDCLLLVGRFLSGLQYTHECSNV